MVYDDESLTEKTNERMAEFRKTEYSTRRKVCGNTLYKSINVPKSDVAGKLKQLAKNGAFFDAPVGLIVTVDRMFDRWGKRPHGASEHGLVLPLPSPVLYLLLMQPP